PAGVGVPPHALRHHDLADAVEEGPGPGVVGSVVHREGHEVDRLAAVVRGDGGLVEVLGDGPDADQHGSGGIDDHAGADRNGPATAGPAAWESDAMKLAITVPTLDPRGS